MKIPRLPPTSRKRARAFRSSHQHLKLVAVPILAAGLALAGSLSAQAEPAPSLLAPGDAVVTGFSGATSAETPDKRFIDLDGPSMQILARASGVVSVSDETGGNPLARFKVKAGQVGQVFGITLDDNSANGQPSPNIYLTATSLFGIQIVTPDADGDGQPERTSKGSPKASFMDGQFGLIEGAGPGTVYKVDGVSGEVTVFANITLDGKSNSGPGLGNIVFDPKSRQFFVADLDTGMIHRLDLSGVPADHFDHGVAGRSAAGLDPVEHDETARMDITSPSFDSEKPDTWGLASPERRVFGLAVRDGRLYYSVNGATRQIWSVSIQDDGSFGEDAQLEIDIPASEEGDSPMITDLAFDGEGRLYLGQRGGMQSSFDYTVFSPSGGSKVLRYAKDPSTGGWSPEPESYAIGMKPDHNESAGGVAIGNGPGGNSCNMLWSTGDQLKPEQVVHGIQGNRISLVRPQNVPPSAATFSDYDGKVNEEGTEGHVGDVEVLRVCNSAPVPQLVPAASPVPVPIGGGYLVPSHWKYGSDGHSKIRSHRKYGSWGHTKRRSHWKCASYGHRKRRSHYKWFSGHHSKKRSHWKFASRTHFKRRSHHKWGSLGHRKRRSHWKCFSHVHTKRRSHWKYASYVHTKRRSHWKYASHIHFKRRSHWKFASRIHTKRRSHFKHASHVHRKRRSHWKFASRVHTKRRSHFKHSSQQHSRLRSHYRKASRVHSRRRSHYKNASRVHSRRRSHFRKASRVHLRSRSHFRKASRVHSRRISRGTTHRRRISRGVTHRRRASRGAIHHRRISAGHIKRRRFDRVRTLRQRRLRQIRRFRPARFNRAPAFRGGGLRRGGFGGRGFRR